MNKERLMTLSLIVLIAAASRVLPHPYNFAPIAAIALFAGAKFERKSLAFIVPLCALLLGDAVLGFYPQLWVTYLGFCAVVCIGFCLRGRAGALPVVVGTLSSSVLFYLITNCALWLPYDIYPHTFDGMIQGYVAGIPFFKNTLLGDAFYSTLLFGAFALAERKFSWLQVRGIAA